MASDQKFVDYVVEQINLPAQVSFKKMFGEYALYHETKLFGLVCDNKFYVKPTTAGREFIGKPQEAPPYPGAKPSFLIEEKLDDRDWLKELVTLTVKELPQPKLKVKKAKK